MKINIQSNLGVISFDYMEENKENEAIKNASWKQIKSNWKPSKAMRQSIKSSMILNRSNDEECHVMVPNLTPVAVDALAVIMTQLDKIAQDNDDLKRDNNEIKRGNKKMKKEIKELQNSNEQLQNSNEQLQNSNEQLQNSYEQLQNSNEQLSKRTAFLEDFVDPVAKRFLFEKLRSKVFAFKTKQYVRPKTAHWNNCVDSLTTEDCMALHLRSKEDLEITKYSDRPEVAYQKVRAYNEIDECVSSTVHEAKPEYVATMVQRCDSVAMASIFMCVYDGKSPDDVLREARGEMNI